MPIAITDIFVTPGVTPLTVDAPVHNTQQDLTAITATSPNAAGPSGTPTYLWAWLRRPLGSATAFSSSTAETPTLTPDVVGLYEAKCTVTLAGQTNVFVESWAVGLVVDAGVSAKVLVDTDYEAEGDQDISSGGAVTIGGKSARSSVSGSPDVWAVQNGTGLRMTEASGSVVTCRLSYDLASLGVVAGDTVIMELDVDPLAMNKNDDRIFCALTQTDVGLGSDYTIIVLRRVGASDYAWYARASVGGVLKDGTLDTSMPGDWRACIAAGDRQSDARCDIDSGGLTTPTDITFRAGLRNTDSQSNNNSVGSRFVATTANLYAQIIIVGGDSDLVVRRIRISCVSARGQI
jgi:hypothetical protein